MEKAITSSSNLKVKIDIAEAYTYNGTVFEVGGKLFVKDDAMLRDGNGREIATVKKGTEVKVLEHQRSFNIATTIEDYKVTIGRRYVMKYKYFLYVLVFIFFMTICNKVFAWEYIGYAQAVQTVKICPDISTRITKIHFHEGDFINKSERLFTLNTAEFQAEVSLRKAELAMAQAKFDGASKYFTRLKATKKAISGSDLDNAESEMLQAKAAVDAAKANLKLAEIQLGYTEIKAPFSGKVGKINFHIGSYVSTENILCEIVQINPIRILFAMPDRDYLSIKDSHKNLKYEIVLSDGSIHSGAIEKDFDDNVMNPDTGTINIWLKVNNENNILLPGALVRVKVIAGD